MKSITSKALAIQVLLIVTLSHALPSQAAGIFTAVHQSMNHQAYVSPGIADLMRFLGLLLR